MRVVRNLTFKGTSDLSFTAFIDLPFALLLFSLAYSSAPYRSTHYAMAWIYWFFRCHWTNNSVFFCSFHILIITTHKSQLLTIHSIGAEWNRSWFWWSIFAKTETTACTPFDVFLLRATYAWISRPQTTIETIGKIDRFPTWLCGPPRTKSCFDTNSFGLIY